jgi:hypothetical protein
MNCTHGWDCLAAATTLRRCTHGSWPPCCTHMDTASSCRPWYEAEYHLLLMRALTAVVKLTQSLAAEWADRGVTVNCVSPGIVNTALIQVGGGALPIACLRQATSCIVSSMHMEAQAHIDGFEQLAVATSTCRSRETRCYVYGSMFPSKKHRCFVGLQGGGPASTITTLIATAKNDK